MAREQGASRIPTPTKASAASSTPPRTSVRVPTAEDLDLARDDALLQLRIGRSAHYYTILVAGALLFDAFVVLFFPPTTGGSSAGSVRALFFLLFPLIGGVFLAAFGLRVKWETYQLWPWELHFWVSIGAVVFNVGLGVLYFASLLHVGPTASWSLVPWFYPLVLAGLTVALVGLALTWSEWTQRKIISVVSGALPVPIGLVVYFVSIGSSSGANALALSLATAAVLYLISGGFLHIISSGTRTHEREVITSGQSRIFQVAEEVRRREEALRFREATLLKREADTEDTEASLRRQRESLDQARAQHERMESDIVQRGSALQKQEQTWVAQAAETNTLARTTQDKESDLQLREKDLVARLPKLAEREQGVTQKEADHRQREVELLRREQELERRQQGIPEGEANLERRKQEIDRRTTELLQRESQLRTREAAAGTGGPTSASLPPGGIEDREARLAQLKITLDEQNLVLGRRSRQVDESMAELLRRETEIAQRENGATSRETNLTQRETDAQERYELGEQRRQEYEDAVKRYEEKVRDVDRRDAELGSRRGEVDRSSSTLQQREVQLKERESQTSIQRTALDRLQRVLAERQKALEAREDELALRSQAVARTRTAPAIAVPIAPAETAAPDLLSPPVARHLPDRAPTGTPRLDDLLLGGIPPKGHVLLMGDTFVGKEVVLYAFIAEGLKRGEPAILVTTSRSPDEIAQQIGLVAPQFREYEQLGKVSWIDASSASGTPPASMPLVGRTVVAVKGPEDHAGILSALVGAAKRAEAGGSTGFRVGFLGFSASVAHGDERAISIFLQNFVGILKPRSALALYSMEAGTMNEAQVERILGRMDGAIRFKQDRDKTLLSVVGLGEVATHDWIECRATNRALVVGSFSLERIR